MVNKRQIFKPIIVANGEVTGTWKRTLQEDSAFIEHDFFKKPGRLKRKSIAVSAKQCGKFLKLKVDLQK